ncbi:MAG: GIY-YIG nuclease family protein [bacterium]|nr:GIY-YIG nuclease family protein [bacterium]
MKTGYVYIMSNKKRSSFYIGVTSNLQRRVSQHKDSIGGKFTSRYNCFYLVYFETIPSIVATIAREKQLKNWHRQWKIEPIQSVNPDMKDLSEDFAKT